MAHMSHFVSPEHIRFFQLTCSFSCTNWQWKNCLDKQHPGCIPTPGSGVWMSQASSPRSESGSGHYHEKSTFPLHRSSNHTVFGKAKPTCEMDHLIIDSSTMLRIPTEQNMCSYEYTCYNAQEYLNRYHALPHRRLPLDVSVATTKLQLIYCILAPGLI
jgi:hypothetical protein